MRLTFITREYVKENFVLLYEILSARPIEVKLIDYKSALANITYATGVDLRMQKFATLDAIPEEGLKRLMYLVVEQAIFGIENSGHNPSGAPFYSYPGVLSLMNRDTILLNTLIDLKPKMYFLEGRKLRVIYDDEPTSMDYLIDSLHRIDFEIAE